MTNEAIDSACLSDLVGKIYDAAIEPARWPVFLERIAQVSNSEGTLIFMHDFATSGATVDGSGAVIAAHTRFDPAYMQSLAQYYNTVNVWVKAEDRLPEGVPVTGAMLYPESKLPATEWYADWLRPQGYFHALGGIVLRKGTLAVKFSSLRAQNQGDYGAEHLALYEALIPHLRRACELHRHVSHAAAIRDSGLHVLDALPMGVIFLDISGHALFINQAAKRIVDQGDGFTVDALGECSAAIRSETASLRQLIGNAVRTGQGEGIAAGGTIRLSRRRSPQPLSVVVSPLPPRILTEEATPGFIPAAVLLVSDPDHIAYAPSDILAKLYGLTPAEANLAAAIVGGQRLEDYAQRRRVSRNTVATQLKRIMNKTGSRRQTDLVKLVLTSPATLQLTPESTIRWRSPPPGDHPDL